MGIPEFIAIFWMTGGVGQGVYNLVREVWLPSKYRPDWAPKEWLRPTVQIIGPFTWASLLYLGGFFS